MLGFFGEIYTSTPSVFYRGKRSFPSLLFVRILTVPFEFDPRGFEPITHRRVGGVDNLARCFEIYPHDFYRSCTKAHFHLFAKLIGRWSFDLYDLLFFLEILLDCREGIE